MDFCFLHTGYEEVQGETPVWIWIDNIFSFLEEVPEILLTSTLSRIYCDMCHLHYSKSVSKQRKTGLIQICITGGVEHWQKDLNCSRLSKWHTGYTNTSESSIVSVWGCLLMVLKCWLPENGIMVLILICTKRHIYIKGIELEKVGA